MKVNASLTRLATWGLLFFLAATGHNALALSFGSPELESGLGERLRVVLPLVGLVKEPLTVDCIKLNASANEPYDVSNLVRATLIPRGGGQAVVLTTAQTMNEVVVSFEAGIGCGIWFSRRYTFFLDLPRDRPPAPAATAPPLASAESLPAAPAAAAGAPAKPPRRLRLREDAINVQAAAATRAPASVVRRLRPEDEPGVLPRARTRQPARQALAPPVRSMLKIDIGGINDLLTGALRSPLEQSTGMRISAELGGNAHPPAATTADAGFKQAHARYLAAMRDKPDPVSVENQALAQRLDAVAKDIASLRLELQNSAARAKELEASRVSWWWLLVAAVLSAAAAGLVPMLRKAPARQLILIDPDERPARGRASRSRSAVEGPEPDSDDTAGNTVITETIAMSRGQRVDRATRRAHNQGAQERPDAATSAGAPAEADAAAMATTGSESSASAAGGRAPGSATDSAATGGTAGTNAGAAGAMAIGFDLPPPALTPTAPDPAPSATGGNSTLKYSAPIAALRTAVPAPADEVLRIIPQPALTALKPDKNSLTQQLASLDELSDESWASYRHPSDSSAVAMPSGALGASGSNNFKTIVNLVPIDADTDASRASTIEINFDLDAEMANYEKSAAKTQPAALEFDPAAAAALATLTVSAQSGTERGAELGSQVTPKRSAPTAPTVDLLNFDFDDPAADADRTEKLPPPDRTAALAHQTNMPSSDRAMLMQVMMATASGVMESAQRQWDTAGAAEAMKLLMPYLHLAPPNTPPGPWIMLAHVLRAERMQNEYAAVAKTFLDRFGAALPDWEKAADLADEQLGLARAPGLEIVAANQRGTAALVGRLAGLAYRIDVPPAVLFDLQFHRQVLLLAAECSLDDAPSGPDMDLAL